MLPVHRLNTGGRQLVADAPSAMLVSSIQTDTGTTGVIVMYRAVPPLHLDRQDPEVTEGGFQLNAYTVILVGYSK